MTERKQPSPSSARLHGIGRNRRLLFLYLFRDFDKGTLDLGLEFTSLAPIRGDRILCNSVTMNIKGLNRDRFIVDRSTRRILELPGRYVCYWVDRASESAHIYDRHYQRGRNGKYVHNSNAVKSELTFDELGLEVSAENLVSKPRRYHEKFLRLVRF